MQSISLDECAAQVLETVPLVMKTVRAEMRRHRAADLTVPQFRALGFLSRRSGASLSEAADHLGLALPSMSSLVSGLVERGLVVREEDANDRRRVMLTLTPTGQAQLEAIREATRAGLADRLTTLSPRERAMVAQAMRAMRALFECSPGEGGR